MGYGAWASRAESACRGRCLKHVNHINGCVDGYPSCDRIGRYMDGSVGGCSVRWDAVSRLSKWDGRQVVDRAYKDAQNTSPPLCGIQHSPWTCMLGGWRGRFIAGYTKVGNDHRARRDLTMGRPVDPL